MGIGLGKVQVLACQGKLDWLCKCLTLEQILWLLHNFDDLTDEGIADRYTLACCVSKKSAGDGNDPAATSVCVQKLLDSICSPAGRDRLRMAKVAVDALRAVPGLGDFPITRKALDIAALAIDALEMACENKKTTNGAARMACSAREALLKVAGEASPFAPLAKPVLQFFNDGDLGKAIDSCCADPLIKAAVLPDWIVLP